MPLPAQKPLFRVQTLCQRSVTFPYDPANTTRDLKNQICNDKDLKPNEIMIIADGKECSDNDPAPLQSHVLLRTNAESTVEVIVKHQTAPSNHCNKENIALTLPLNTRISKLKTQLLKDKHTKLSPSGQRLISCSKVMKDHQMIGDFILLQKKGSRGTPLTIFLSQTIDSREEMEIHVTLRNKQEIKFYLEFGIPLYYAKEILQNQFGISKSHSYHFVRDDTKQPLLDLHKSLLDYGILPSWGKKLQLVLAPGERPLPTTGFTVFMPSGCDSMGVDSFDVCSKRKLEELSYLKIPSQNSDENAEHIVSDKPASRASSPVLFSSATLKKKPNGRKSPTCGMFGGMKKGFLSKRKKH